MLHFFATCAKNIEGLLREELIALGAQEVKETVAGVYFRGELETAYRVCLWSRLANHILLKLQEFEAPDDRALYDAVQTIDWSEHLDAEGSLHIDVTGHHRFLNNTLFIAQRAKDAIVDQCRDKTGKRPSVISHQPQIALNLHIEGTHCILSVSLSGESLHRRGYRLEAGRAPLKETLAAVILIRAGWNKEITHLLDPMCGTGTLLVEAAQMAFDIAPGLDRDYFGFLGWKQHQPEIWTRLLADARARKTKGLSREDIVIQGSDSHPQAIAKSRDNIESAGLSDRISVELKDCRNLKNQGERGLMVCNPPYGERMHSEDLEELKSLFQQFGECLKAEFQGWQLAIFSGAPQECTKALGIRAKKYYPFFNGTLPCRLFLFDLTPEQFMKHETPEARQQRQLNTVLEQGLSEHAQMFQNRLLKNLKNLEKWAKREGVTCYRIYDADLPEYAVAVDFYEGQFLHVQEYQAPKEIDPNKAKHRLKEVLGVLHKTFNLPSERLFLKIRRSQKEGQYEKQNESGAFHIIHEGPAQLYVNFTDYLDTGIFLDHRILRHKAAEASQGKRFLNLFAYTCTAGIQAALAGAKHVTNVDLSNPYLTWGERNAKLNKLDLKQIEFVQADCLQWIEQSELAYDVIFLNPPTFSNSKRMDTTWDVQRDHVNLIHETLKLLTPEGILYFSCNLKNFKMNTSALAEYDLKNISHITCPMDFERRANMHHVWEIRHHE